MKLDGKVRNETAMQKRNQCLGRRVITCVWSVAKLDTALGVNFPLFPGFFLLAMYAGRTPATLAAV